MVDLVPNAQYLTALEELKADFRAPVDIIRKHVMF